MGRPIETLTAVEVRAAVRKQDKLRKIGDGGGLWLVVGQTRRTNRDDKVAGPASWVFRYTLKGKTREMGLGSYPAVTLEAARKRARAARELLGADTDPFEHRALERAKAAESGKPIATFRECALAHIEAKAPGWTNAKHAGQWRNTFETFVFPVFGNVPVSLINSGHVVQVLSPIWLAKNQTAIRVRQRIEAVLDSARARGQREGENPARLRGHLENLLPEYRGRVKHHPAIPHQEIGTFMEKLRKQEGIAAKALEFVILCASRTNECLGAKWPEIDLDSTVWTIPGDRTKTRREHKIPLSAAAQAVLDDMRKVRVGEYIFPGARLRRPLSNMAMLALMGRMGHEETVHGFRSSFRDWAADTGVSNEIGEMCLAHAVEDKTEGAYRRGNLLEARRPVMQRWAGYCATPSGGQVVSMTRAALSA
jgi:integrase